MSEMQDNESIERFVEGLKKAASRARELGIAQKNSSWEKVAVMLDGIRTNGVKLYQSSALSRNDVLSMLDQRQKTMKIPQ